MIDFSEVGAFASVTPDGFRIRFGLYLPSIRSTEGFDVGLCRKVGFWRQNPKIGSRKINHLRVSTFLFSVICDRARSL